MKVSEVMNKAFIVDGRLNLKSAAKIMSDKNIGSLLIVNDGKIKGIITERDIIKNIGKLMSKVSDVMIKNVIVIKANESIDSAASIMSEKKIKRLPIIENGMLVGIITMTDIIAHTRNLNEDDFFIN